MSGRVRRGTGAARQDVNVSVAGGRRTEIKGVHHHRGLPQLVHIEGFRQLNLLRIREELRQRGVTVELLDGPLVSQPVESSPHVLDATSILAGSDFAPLRDCLDRGEKAAAVRLPGFAGLLVRRTQPGLTFANEFADRVRVIACLTSRPFMIHSDIEGYGLSHTEWLQLRKSVRAEGADAVIVLWGPERDLATAVREVFLRAHDALVGVPAETRQAFPDGTTGFERILPGADRMYPDTDTPPVPIPDEMVGRVQARMPERPWEKEARFLAMGLDAATARRLVDAPWCALFEELAPEPGALARRIAFALEKRLPHWRRGNGSLELPTVERLRPWADALREGRVRPETCEPILDLLLRDAAPTNAVLEHFAHGKDDESIIEQALAALAESTSELHAREEGPALRWAMGRLMPKLLGRADPDELQRRAKEVLPQGDAR
jgi:glutamyl-tRNA(Gln) amidotransferase subunit E